MENEKVISKYYIILYTYNSILPILPETVTLYAFQVISGVHIYFNVCLANRVAGAIACLVYK